MFVQIPAIAFVPHSVHFAEPNPGEISVTVRGLAVYSLSVHVFLVNLIERNIFGDSWKQFW